MSKLASDLPQPPCDRCTSSSLDCQHDRDISLPGLKSNRGLPPITESTHEHDVRCGSEQDDIESTPGELAGYGTTSLERADTNESKDDIVQVGAGLGCGVPNVSNRDVEEFRDKAWAAVSATDLAGLGPSPDLCQVSQLSVCDLVPLKEQVMAHEQCHVQHDEDGRHADHGQFPRLTEGFGECLVWYNPPRFPHVWDIEIQAGPSPSDAPNALLNHESRVLILPLESTFGSALSGGPNFHVQCFLDNHDDPWTWDKHNMRSKLRQWRSSAMKTSFQNTESLWVQRTIDWPKTEISNSNNDMFRFLFACDSGLSGMKVGSSIPDPI
jgi:hypothetical protein